MKSLGVTHSDVEIARRNLYSAVMDADMQEDTDGMLRRVVEEGIAGQREHFDNLGLRIGYVYCDPSIPTNALIYRLAFVPGARLLHAWISLLPSASSSPPLSSSYLSNLPRIDCSYVTEFTPQDLAARQFPTLDLCAFDAVAVIADIAFAK